MTDETEIKLDPKQKAAEREQIAAQVAEYMKQGGKITQFPYSPDKHKDPVAEKEKVTRSKKRAKGLKKARKVAA